MRGSVSAEAARRNDCLEFSEVEVADRLQRLGGGTDFPWWFSLTRLAAPLETLPAAMSTQVAPAAPMDAADALGDDPFKPHFARLGEHKRVLGCDRLAEQDGVGALDDALKLRTAILEPLLANVLAVEL